ncbi:unnamed protein product [Rhizoctonia solani]|uniref:CHAT domain-containing protein n=1 Tax=Rhizoctonia solani TaxID=456999 RepID=A0A8H3DZM2_9AGAM|nr:unnamed protein product [Rhizoctonia solani]
MLRVLPQTPNDDPKLRSLLICLAEAYSSRFDLLEDPNDIQKVIEHTTMGLSLTPDEDPNLRNLLSTLGIAHSQRFQCLGVIDDIEESIKFKSLSVAKTPDDHPDLPRQLSNLAVSHKHRFIQLGELEDIDKAIEYDTRAVAVTSEDDPLLSELLEKLGTSHGCRFRRLGELNDLEKAIEYQSHGVTIASDDCAYLPTMLTNLGSSHNYRFQRLGELDDLEKAIQYHARVLALTPNDHPDLPSRLSRLGSCQRSRFQRLGELNDLDGAVECESRALVLTPDGHPDLPGRLANLALSQKNRFRRLGELGDLEKAIECECRALAMTPESHPDLPGRLANLAVSHRHRFQRLGEQFNLDKSIELESRALSMTPDNHPDLPNRLANLGIFYEHRFQRLGELDDLDKAIEYEYRALSLIPDDHPALIRLLANLGASHTDRFGRLGELDDLEKAIEYQLRALELTTDSHPDLPSRLNNVGSSHQHRFIRLGQLDDLEKAIEYQSRALGLTPDDHPDLPTRLANLGVSHEHRFQLMHNLDDLEKAIDHKSRALTLTPDGHLDLPGRLANLGVTHRNRFLHLGNVVDLEKAIKYGAQALNAISNDHPDSCLLHFNQALFYIMYYEHSSDPSHLQQALRLFRIASTSLAGAPRDRFGNARKWADLTFKHSILNPIEAYETTIDLLPQFIWLGATTDQRYQDLKTIETLAVEAARAAIISSNHSLALEWLEHARCIVWSQHLMLRSPLDRLEALHPSIAIRLKAVAQDLHSTSLTSREVQSSLSGTTTTEEVGQRHRHLAKEYNQLLNQARSISGFEDFLLPVRANRLTGAARNGPIVVINCHTDRCDALVVLPQQGNVAHIPLPSFNGEKARTARSDLRMSVESLRFGERGIERRPMAEAGQELGFGGMLSTLWYDVVKPVLDHLGYMNNVQPDSLPHITWCPTGAMTFLPLHAAGDYDQPRSRVFDYVISSYTPTLTAILEPTQCSPNHNPRVLAIGQAATPGHAPLPGTALELDRVKSHMQSKFEYTQLMDKQATTTVILDEMERHDWVHFACHAHQNVSDAKQSGFFLHDGVLELDAINRHSFKGKGLAFLSACQTATGDETLPDEAVHLASGMLMAGYSNVIATMWSVVDEDAPFVADKVYGLLMKEGKLENGEAGKALHDAVAGLRERVGEKDFGRWIPYIHLGS